MDFWIIIYIFYINYLIIKNMACKIFDDAIANYELKLFPTNSIVFAKSGLSCVKNRVYLAYIVNHPCVLYNIRVSYILQNGDITLQDLYTHNPFTSMDYLKIFNGETAPIYDLINTLHHAVCIA